MSTLCIGVDPGNGFFKTRSAVIKTGVAEYKEAPPIETPYTVRIGKNYYVCNSGRGPLKRDKTIDETYWYLTLAGIGAELKNRKIVIPTGERQDIILAAGLPLTYPKEDRLLMRKYLMRGQVNFWFERTHYKINIKDVMIFPQGYAAIMTQINDFMNEPIVNIVDIGSWTVDVLTLNRGIPNMDRARSLEYGVTRCIDEIIEQVRRKTKKSITQEQIEAVLWPSDEINIKIPDNICDEIKYQAGKYIANVVNKLIEAGFDVFSVYTVFIGGGAYLVEQYFNQADLFYPLYIPDVKSNALGNEIAAEAAIKAMALKKKKNRG